MDAIMKLNAKPIAINILSVPVHNKMKAIIKDMKKAVIKAKRCGLFPITFTSLGLVFSSFIHLEPKRRGEYHKKPIN